MMFPLYTLGYSGWTPEGLYAQVATLDAALWDIRMSPWSRTPVWCREALEELLGTAYAHMRRNP